MSLTSSSPMPSTVVSARQVGKYPGRERVTVTFARLVGKSEGWSHARLYGCPRLVDLTVAAIRAYRLSGDLKGLAGFAALIRDALADQPAPRLTPDLILSEQHADGSEDVSEAAFLLSPCRETATAFVRNIDAAHAKSGAVRAAVVARWLS